MEQIDRRTCVTRKSEDQIRKDVAPGLFLLASIHTRLGVRQTVSWRNRLSSLNILAPLLERLVRYVPLHTLGVRAVRRQTPCIVTMNGPGAKGILYDKSLPCPGSCAVAEKVAIPIYPLETPTVGPYKGAEKGGGLRIEAFVIASRSKLRMGSGTRHGTSGHGRAGQGRAAQTAARMVWGRDAPSKSGTGHSIARSTTGDQAIRQAQPV